MNDGFKQRLVGALVLISIAVIVWPMVFSGPNSKIMNKTSQIPERPTFEKFAVPEPVKPQGLPAVARPQLDPQEEVINTEESEKPSLDRQSLPAAWVLQVASFEKTDNAELLKAALQKMGYKAFTRQIDSQATRVYVGPRLTKQDFLEDQQLIDKTFSLKTMVVRYEQ